MSSETRGPAAPYTVIDIETTGSYPWQHDLVCVGLGSRVYPPNRGRRLVREAMETPGAVIVCHSNYDLRWLMLDGGRLHPTTQFHDTKVMAWMLDANQVGQLSLEDLAVKHLGYRPPKVLSSPGGRVMFRTSGGRTVPIGEAPWDELAAYNQSDIDTEARLYECLRGELQARGMWDRFVTEEAPFSRLLVEMEVHGLPVDVDAARELLAEVECDWAELRARLVDATGSPDFNPASGDQVAAYLYGEVWTSPTRFPIPRLAGVPADEKARLVADLAPDGVEVTRIGREYAYGDRNLMGLGLVPPKPGKKDAGKKRPTVSAKKLDVLYGDHPWVGNYVRFQKQGKLGGYLRDWVERQHGGRLYGRFDQSATATGRLAGREPNLQQVDNGPTVRGLFRGDLIVGDYAGLEARLAAHFSGDPVMLDIYRSGKDLYGVLASQAWGGPDTKANEGRPLMKVLWLASQYGAQGETLSNTMAENGLRGYTPKKADALLRDLRFAAPRLFEWREEVIEEARACGYTTTIGGRVRQLPNLYSNQWGLMAAAERQAVSTRVQGSAADIVRRAMLAARGAVPPTVAAMCLQVHDEIMWEVGPDWYEEAYPLLVGACETGHGFTLSVPLAFECVRATSWADKA